MTAPHALHDTNRGGPWLPHTRSTAVQSRIDGGVGRHRTEAELGFSGFSFSMAIEH